MVKQPVLILLFCTLFITTSTFSQKSIAFESTDLRFQQGLKFYEEGRYGSARQYFATFLKENEGNTTTLIAEAEYFHAQSAKMLTNNDAESLFIDFIEHHPESGKVQYAYFRLGEINSDKNKYRQAIRWYQKVKPSNLEYKDRTTYFFKTGYAHFASENDEEALTFFSKIKDQSSEYQNAAIYYFSHLQYKKGNYQTALDGFNKIKNDPAFKPVIPYYIAQIYFLQKEYDKAIEFGEPLLESSSKARKIDMARVLGGAHYQKKQYSKAIEFFDMVMSSPNEVTREDYFHIGYSYYAIKDYTKAAEYLSQVTTEQDIMSQYALFYLGDCYLKSNDKKRARVAFEAASKYQFDPKIEEEAAFTTIKLDYDLSISPFNDIISSFTNFITRYPKSSHIDEAYDYLSKTFLSTKNYPMAIESLEKIGKKDANVYRSIQRVAYYRGLQLYNDMELNDAIKMLDYSLKYPDYNKTLKVKALYWRGEIKYKLGAYQDAISDYTTFLTTPGSYGTTEFANAHYNIAYAYFNQKDYTNANQWFRKYLSVAPSTPNAITADTYNRIGDCYFVEREFDLALQNYNSAIKNGLSLPDYAQFQKGITLGVMKKPEQKISALNELITNYPSSSYVDDALFESARSYVELNNLPEAIKRYKTVKERYPQSGYAKKSLQQLGLVYYNNGEYDNSLLYFKRVVNEYPGSQESNEALAGIRNIYVEKGDLESYYAYTKSLGSYVKIEVSEQDSLSYISAEKNYMAGKCDLAIKNLQNYLNSFPEGKYSLNAHFYKADCLYRAGAKAEAYEDYKVVLLRGKNDFTEEALINSATYLYENKSYNEALPLYTRLVLEAEVDENRRAGQIGEMQCYAKTNQDEEAIVAADKTLKLGKLEPEITREAQYIKAIAYKNLQKTEQALVEFKSLATNVATTQGAEAKYWIAQALYEKGDYDKAEAEVFDFAKKGTPHQYWLARSFVLLSDIYLTRKENLQAQQYLESVKANYKGTNDDIMSLVDERLKRIADAQQKPKPKSNFSIENN